MGLTGVEDVITGVSALETRLAGMHPRLYMDHHRVIELRHQVVVDPWAGLFKRLIEAAEGAVRNGHPPSTDSPRLDRSHGNHLPHLALAYVLTGERRYLSAATAFVRAGGCSASWDTSLVGGHLLYGMALAYDWLHADMDAQTLEIARDALTEHGRTMFDYLANYRGWSATVYACNHLPVCLGGLAAAGMALHGEVADVGPWLRLTIEKLRLMTAALGPDGCSPEGTGYWSYYLEYLLKTLDLARDLLGVDLFADCGWLRQTAEFCLFSQIPRAAWTRASHLFNFGDGPRHYWYGPDYLLRKLASEYQNPHAQWLADAMERHDLCHDVACWLNLFWYDLRVKAELPSKLPLFKHFEDLGLVFMRSDWEGNALALKCGPHAGRRALEHYPQDVGGGHIHPDAGTFQIFACGDWLIVDDGYAFKMTAYQNSILLNGRGQTGEGVPWFESIELRREGRGPRILRADTDERIDYVIADLAPAYDKDLGIQRLLRHVLYLKPDCWVLFDEVRTEAPASVEILFHADVAFEACGDRVWRAVGPRGALQLTALTQNEIAGEAVKQPIRDTEGHVARELDCLRLYTPSPMQAGLFVTVLEAYPAEGGPQISCMLEKHRERLLLGLECSLWSFDVKLDPERRDVSQAIVAEIEV